MRRTPSPGSRFRPIRMPLRRRICSRMAYSVRAEGPRPAEDPHEGLLRRMARGDETALEALFDALSARVHGLSYRILGDRSASEEATLDAFHQVWRQAGRYDPERGSVAVWVLTVARTRALDLRRVRVRRADREGPLEEAATAADPEPGPEVVADASLRAGRVRAALGLLSEDQRAAIEMAFFEGMTHREAAVALGAPLGTVKTRIRSGLEAIRTALATEEGIA